MKRFTHNRKMARSVGAIAVLVAWAAAAHPCQADGSETAKAKINQGKVLIEKEDYLGALVVLEEAFALEPRPSVLYNIGMCQKALCRYTQAIASFKQYLEKTRSEADAELRKMASQAIAELEPLLGTLAIEGAPQRAEVRIDGVTAAQLPMDGPLGIDPGEHVVEVRSPGYAPLRKTVRVSIGARTEVDARLEPLTARVQVDCGEDDGTVLVDGQEVGPCPVAIDIEPGPREIRVEQPGKKPFVKTLDPRAGSTALVTVAFREEDHSDPPDALYLQKAGEEAAETWRWIRYGGWSAIGLGVVSAALGGYFTYSWNQSYDRLEDAAARAESATGAEWEAAFDDYTSAQSDAVKDVTGLTISFAAAGALSAVGAVLLVLDLKFRSQDETYALVPVPGGVAARF